MNAQELMKAAAAADAAGDEATADQRQTDLVTHFVIGQTIELIEVEAAEQRVTIHLGNGLLIFLTVQSPAFPFAIGSFRTQ